MTDAKLPEPNYDEARVPDCVLPEALLCTNGRTVTSVNDWETLRRPELLELFRAHVYGRIPEEAAGVSLTVEHEERFTTLEGRAEATQYAVVLSSRRGTLPLDVLLVLPAGGGPVPVFTALNFRGNHTILADPRIRITHSWIPADEGVVNNRATAAARGSRADRWPLDLIVSSGYGLAAAYCGDLDPDYDDGFLNGVHGLVSVPSGRDRQSWGTISGWAWGLSRIVDLLLTNPRVDPARIAVLGHSRLGKAALWAAAQDSRFAAAISNDSGCGGAAITRREYGETVWAITTRFPHWFCEAFAGYANRADALPVDQHELLAVIAPRPVAVGSAEDDRWADPYGEYLSVYHAGPVYRLYGHETVRTPERPRTGARVGDRVRYHCRGGGHDL